MKKTVQGIAIAISALVISQSAFAKASDSLKRLCSNATGGEIVNKVRLSRYIESWTGQNPESYIVIDSSTNITLIVMMALRHCNWLQQKATQI